MTVTVSGMTVTGKTRALPKVNFAFSSSLLWESTLGANYWTGLDNDDNDVTVYCRLCNRMLLPANSKKQSRL